MRVRRSPWILAAVVAVCATTPPTAAPAEKRGQAPFANYLHVFERPAGGVLVVPGLLNEVRRARPLAATGDSADLHVVRAGDDVRITLPVPGDAAAPVEVIAFDIAGDPDVAIPPSIDADAAIFIDGLDVRISSDRANVQVRYTVDGQDPGAGSPEARGPVRLNDSAIVKARAFRGPRPVSPVAEATFTRVEPRKALAAAAGAPGLSYRAVSGEFAVLPTFADPAAKTGTVQGFDVSVRPRDTGFAILYTGYLRVPKTGVYRFYLRSDDGSRLWLRDSLLIDNEGLHSSREMSADAALEVGLHEISVEMFERDGGFELGVSWSGPGRSKQKIPNEFLSLRTPRAP